MDRRGQVSKVASERSRAASKLENVTKRSGGIESSLDRYRCGGLVFQGHAMHPCVLEVLRAPRAVVRQLLGQEGVGVVHGLPPTDTKRRPDAPGAYG